MPTSSQIQRPRTEPAPESNTGLKALFQQPTRLKSRTASYPSKLVHLQTGPNDSTFSLQVSLVTMPSQVSLHSQVSELSTQERPSVASVQISQFLVMHHRPSFASTKSEPTVKPVYTPIDETSTAYRIALSQLYAYQARMTNRSSYEIEPVPTPENGATPENGVRSSFASTVPQSSQHAPTDVTALLDEGTAAAQSSNYELMTPELNERRSIADSQAWQRKTQMLR